MSKNRKKRTVLLFIVVFIIGLLTMLYPTISNYISNYKYSKVIETYSNNVKTISNEKIEKILQEAYNYNENLEASVIKDMFSSEESNDSEIKYNNILKINSDSSMGYIEIPKIEVKLPIYHGTDESVLHKGVGHIHGTSLPVGGKGTHSILAAHRGLPSSRLFADLDKLNINDIFNIYILNKKLTYKIDNISVIKPNEFSKMNTEEKNDDYVTLVTCTPYAVNKYRLLVRGKRVQEETIIDKIEQSKKILPTDVKILLLSLIVVLVLLILFLINIFKSRKRE